MRQTFVATTAARSTMRRRYPWAAVIARADGGWWLFESPDDYRTWRNQR
jgi:hypothetical protein